MVQRTWIELRRRALLGAIFPSQELLWGSLQSWCRPIKRHSEFLSWAKRSRHRTSLGIGPELVPTYEKTFGTPFLGEEVTAQNFSGDRSRAGADL